MSAGTVAAVDLGATSGRVIVGHVGPAALEATTIARFPNEPVVAGDGLHWNLLGMYGSVLGGLRDAFKQDRGIRSIGVDAWAVDYGLLRDGRLLGEPFHYRDARATRGVATVHADLPHERLFERNGLQFLPFNTLYQLASEPREQLIFADTLLLIPDLIGFWLTGSTWAERTNASTTGLLNVATREWDLDLTDCLGVGRRLLPDLVDPGYRVGVPRKEVAALIGAGQDAAVVAVGSHDTASAVAAVPMTAPTAAYISCGTWGLVGVEVEAPVLTETARRAGFTNEGGVDGHVRLLHNTMGLWVLNEAVRSWGRERRHPIELSTLLGAAGEVDPASVVLFDVNDPRFLPPGDMAARIDAWCAEHDLPAPRTRPQYARSIVESLAQAFAEAAAEAGRIGGVDVRTIHMVGGGALNGLLCQRTADRAGIPVLAGPVEATALGNVLVQARAARLVSGSLDALRDLVARTHAPRRHEPRAR